MKKKRFITAYYILLICCVLNHSLLVAYAHKFTPPVLNERLQHLDKDISEKAGKLISLIEKSGAIYSDKQLEDYVSKIGRGLLQTLPPECVKDISFKVIRDPRINAMAFPNGQIFINTGILARLENEAQVAFLLGHEISHAVNKDMVFWRDSYHESTVAIKVLDLIVGTASALVGLGDLGSLGLYFLYAVSVTGYGRNIEARADTDGLKFMVEAGYNPDGAVEMFDIFIQEKEKYAKDIEIFFLSSHPSNIARRKSVVAEIERLNLEKKERCINETEYVNNTEKVRCDNAYMDIRRDRLQHAIDNLEKFLKRNPDNAISHYYIAESYRLIAEDRERLKHELSHKNWLKIKKVEDVEVQKKQWLETALSHYEKAIEYDKDYKDPLKGLGLLYVAMNKKDKAVEYLEEYLKQNPQAKDKRYFYTLIKSLKEKPAGEKK